jgi:F-type H+-transporting ATPase subunit gamma
VPNTRDLRHRIRSVKNTEKVTRAMKMVAAAKLRRSQERILAARPYAGRLKDVLSRLAARTDATLHPLLAERAEEKHVEVLIITGDKGLCGAFNTNIFKTAESFLAGHVDRHITLHIVGRKAREHFKRRPFTVHKAYVDMFRNLVFESAREIGEDMIARYVRGDLDAVYLIHNEFKSALRQQVVAEKLLPLPRIEPEAGAAGEDYLYEPEPAALLDALLPRHVNFQVWAALLESYAAENGARMAAMDAASKNAAEMIERLTLQMNRLRQAAITKEIIEVVSGAQALS